MELVLTPDNPAPDGAIVSPVRTGDGLTLRVARWHPAGVARGTVLVAQGRAEFIEKYFETAADLLARGFVVVTFDWRGQGLSTRELRNPFKGHIDDFMLYERDLDAVIEHVLAPFAPKPWFALAHSTGGAILLEAARRGRSPFERIVLLAPLIDIKNLPARRGLRLLADGLNLLGLGGAYVPGGGGRSIFTRPFKGNRLSSDPRRYARNASIVTHAPRLGVGDPTIGWVHAAFRRIDELADPAYAPSVTKPILVVAAGADRIVSTPAIERFSARLKAGSLIVLDKSGHEILQERDAIRERFWAAFDAFVPGMREQAVLADRAPV
jgi:lysophospholipase